MTEPLSSPELSLVCRRAALPRPFLSRRFPRRIFGFLLPRHQNRSPQSNQQHSPHHRKRNVHGNPYPALANHFPADKNQHHRQPLIQESQPVDDSRQQKIQRAQAKNRQHVRRVHDERVARNSKNRGNRIHRQRHVRNFHNQQHEKQRRCEKLSAVARKELFALIFTHQAQVFAREADHPAFLRMHIHMFEKHPDSRVHQESPSKYSTQEKCSINCAPTPIMIPRITSAPTTPHSSKRCCSRSSTANARKITRNRNRLSTLSAFSIK